MDHAEGTGQLPWAHSQAETRESCPYMGAEGRPGVAAAFFLRVRVARPTGLLLRTPVKGILPHLLNFQGSSVMSFT